MDRRSFLRSLLAAIPAMTFDLERLLWVPGAKTIFIPEPIEPLPGVGGLTWDDINSITLKYITPRLADLVFRPLRFAPHENVPPIRYHRYGA